MGGEVIIGRVGFLRLGFSFCFRRSVYIVFLGFGGGKLVRFRLVIGVFVLEGFLF